MGNRDIQQILHDLVEHRLTVEQARSLLEGLGYEQMDFACVDTDRERRCGWPEVIYGAGKTAEQIVAILKRLRQSSSRNLMATRCDEMCIRDR